jgi:hypothetical protein
LFGLIKDDFTGDGNFIYWVLSILVIGSVGYVKALRPIANGFLLLVMVVLFIGAGKKGFFAQFMAGIKTPATNCGGTGVTTNPFGTSQFSIAGLLGSQAEANPNATYQPGQSIGQQWQNGITNLNNALNTSPTLGGG